MAKVPVVEKQHDISVAVQGRKFEVPYVLVPDASPGAFPERVQLFLHGGLEVPQREWRFAEHFNQEDMRDPQSVLSEKVEDLNSRNMDPLVGGTDSTFAGSQDWALYCAERQFIA